MIYENYLTVDTKMGKPLIMDYYIEVKIDKQHQMHQRNKKWTQQHTKHNSYKIKD